MSDQDNSQTLNELLNRLSRSLLQYIGEAWPWAAGEQRDRLETINGLVRRQQFAAERLSELLEQRRVVLDIQNYPWDGSLFNYVTIDYVKPELIADEEDLLATLKQARAATNGDSEAARLLEQLASDEEKTLADLRDV